ncbi:nitroreductase [Selenomonas montiformis]|uniref:nitroreductase n=1 Tax=Selenomonas montiformis TaxID=2652285 RepID=UPI003F8AAB91
MERQPDMEMFDCVIRQLQDVDDVLLMEGHNKSHKKVSDALDLLNWAEDMLPSMALHCMATRHSTRRFKQELVDAEKLRQVIEAGRQAPSGKNKQQNHFLVVRDPDVLDTLARLVREEFAGMEITDENSEDIGNAIRLSKKGTYVFHYHAPTLIIVANKRGYGNRYADTACAIENMMLAANALDLGSCWINQLRWLKDNPVLLDYLCELGMQEDEQVFGSLSLGYPDTEDGLPNRKILPIRGNEVTYIG